MGTLPGDMKGRTKLTVEKCIAAVLDFVTQLINERKCTLSINELYKYIPYRDKNGITKRKKIPVFDVVYVNSTKEIFRDIPNNAFDMLFAHIKTYYNEIFMLVTLSAFAGLRPSEACNVRREDSVLGPGIFFDIFDNEIHKVQIDLRKELCLRSDLKPVGKIKKERLQKIPLMFTDIFVNSYSAYLESLSGEKYEEEFGALTINKQGKAMTYASYYQKFRKIIKEEMIPKYLESSDYETVLFGRLLLENNLSPHVFRHWFTVQLVLSGMGIAEIMEARGDSSPESALLYLQNKGELVKRYQEVNDEMFNYLTWASVKKNDGSKKND